MSPLRVTTHNIRYATPNLKKNEKPWKERRSLLASQLKCHTRFFTSSCSDLSNGSSSRQPDAAIIGLQEVLHEQLLDIKSDLNEASTKNVLRLDGPDWGYVGIRREMVARKGSTVPLDFR